MEAKPQYTNTTTITELENIILHILKGHIGSIYAVSRIELNEKVAYYAGQSISDRAIRATINEMRKAGALICSRGGEGGGYYMAETYQELLDYLDFEVRPRAMDLLQEEKALRAAAKAIWGDGFQELLF